jgi:amidohydrolase
MIDYKEIRRTLHEHPQTAGNEQFAHDMIVKHLQGLHPTKVYTNVGGYGVIAVWGQEPQAPTVAFRADTDALPIGHRCGHDGHTSILLRLAELVENGKMKVESDAAAPGQLSTFNFQLYTHNILLLWQPAEETGTGSQAVLESGILQQYNIVRFYGLHNLPGYPLGTVVLCPRTFAAASTGVVYHLDGRETHASTPELGINPGMAIAEIINRFNGFNGRDGEFRQSTLICVRIGQPAFGTSAGHGEVMFTLRAFTNDEMEKMLSEANQVVDEVSARYGLKISRSLVEPFCATENNGDCVEAIEKAATEVPLRVRYQMEPNRWSEDFAEYLLHFKGAMFGLGSGEEHAELHHPDYDFPDDLIEPAAQLFFRLIED